MADTDERAQTEAPPSRPSSRKTWIAVGIAVVVGVIVFGVIFPQLVDWNLVFEVLGEVSGAELAVLVTLGLLRYVPAGGIYALVLPGLGLRRGISSWIGTTALSSSTPGFDIPLRFGMYSTWGYRPEQTASAMFLSGIVEMSTKYTLATVGIGLWAIFSFDETLLVLAAIGAAILIVGAVFVAAVLRSEERARQFGQKVDSATRWGLAKISRQAPDDLVERVLDVRLQAREVLGTNWHKAFFAAATSQVFNVVILLLALRAVGVGSDTLAWYDVLLAQGVVIILTTIPITPGNFGIAEIIYMAVFTAIAGRDAANLIAAGVVLSRLITWFLPIPIGWVITLRWQATSGIKVFGGGS